jgi:hypothetical protein
VIEAVPVLAPLSMEEKVKVADCVHEERYVAGDMLLKEGVVGDSMFILLKGGVEVELRGERLAYKETGYFGELTLFNPRPVNDTTVYVRTSEAQVLRMFADDYERIHRDYSQKKQAAFAVGQRPTGNGYLDWPMDRHGRRDRLITRPILTQRTAGAYKNAEIKAAPEQSPYDAQAKPRYTMETNPCVKRTQDLLQIDAYRFATKYDSKYPMGNNYCVPLPKAEECV